MIIREKLIEGATIRSLVQQEADLFKSITRHYRNLSLISEDLLPDRDFKSRVIWISGPTGSGKSTLASRFKPELGRWWKPDSSIWFDGYNREPIVIWDDIRRHPSVGSAVFLRIMDRYPCRVQCKGGYKQWAPKWLIFTCPLTPTKYFQEYLGEDLEQFTRRIDITIAMEKMEIESIQINA